MNKRQIISLLSTAGLLGGGWYALHSAQSVAESPAVSQGQEQPGPAPKASAGAFQTNEAPPVQAVTGASGRGSEPFSPAPPLSPGAPAYGANSSQGSVTAPPVQSITGASGGESNAYTGTYGRKGHKHERTANVFPNRHESDEGEDGDD
ncbi:MAG: hypothetical protein QJR06_05460 [Alicyclobacillaceae bacterium]|nr:hypothetical protein [Alicyclobacillaceae bacterium]